MKPPSRKKSTTPTACPHILIEGLRPEIDGGRWPAKRPARRPCPVEATVFRDGHAKIRAVVRWKARGAAGWEEAPLECINPGLDLWRGEIPLGDPGRYVYAVEAWTDVYASWLADLRKRVAAGLEVRSECLEGAGLLRRWGLDEAAARLEAAAGRGADALNAAEAPDLLADVARRQPREDAVVSPEREISAVRARGIFGAWYEFFPRSQGTVPGRASTLREAERRFPDLQQMGFDVLYLPPIHPIGRTHRKGRNNSLVAGPGDPGSPWAIGSEHGGHDAVEPALGTLEDFDHFVAEARRHGLEVALDFALQCSPDHPWVKEHPEWFYRRPDGTIKYAENPPKKYEDIYPLNFDTSDREALWAEILRVMEHWIAHGVRIFRVDNPHTKPPVFWEWLIRTLQDRHPDVLFLAEAFTRPPMMKALGKLGFTQSYTYFTWRSTRAELTEYLTELTQTEMRDYFLPNFFVNTPDILPKELVHGGPPAFRSRLVLAATLSPTYGIYSGFELCENAAMPHHAFPDDVEYADSEKYEIRVRDWDAPGNIKPLVARLNRIRRENPAFHELANLQFFPSDNPSILFYGRASDDNRILVAVNLDPHRVQEGFVHVPTERLGLPPGASYTAHDLLGGGRFPWGARNYVRLDPASAPAHVLRVEDLR
ncbi:MAG TPA: alpha-1,4-glucan--maltose-1-phosphate maltosyltransferase [Planctomycetota bacterium]|nr:alpha-1,4-glucan--maltose-1-phosphate maltosyltransferase [Planctomycetota bacterium]